MDRQSKSIDRPDRQMDRQDRQVDMQMNKAKQMKRSDRKVVNKTDRHDMDQRIRQTGWTGKTGG